MVEELPVFNTVKRSRRNCIDVVRELNRANKTIARSVYFVLVRPSNLAETVQYSGPTNGTGFS